MRISTSKSNDMVINWKRVVCPLGWFEFSYFGFLFTDEGKMEREIDGAASAVGVPNCYGKERA